MLELVIQFFATGRIMVVTKTRREARRISGALRASCRMPVGCFTRQFTRSDVRIQVGTAGSLDLTVAGVVVLVDAAQALHQRVRDQMLILRHQRLYGLLEDRPGLSRRERLVIEGYVGPVIGRLGPSGHSPAAVVAVFADWAGSERADESVGLEWKRGSIWHNDERNRAVARLAVSLAGGDVETLWEHGLFFDAESAVRPLDHRRVAVLVESVEHARVLGRLLPGWAVLCADAAELGAIDGASPAGLLRNDRDRQPESAIMTWLHAHARGGIEADVVIRADGTPWRFEFSVALSRPREAEQQPVVIVDLADHQDRTARDATRARRLDYRDRGWGSQ